MRKIVLLAVCIFVLNTMHAQEPQKTYIQPLKDVLDLIEKTYNVKLQYEDKILKNNMVEYAGWKLFADVESTLQHVLMPLELRYIVKAKDTYEIKSWEYFRKPYAEGEVQLWNLLASYPTLSDWEARKKEVRQNILSKLGIHHFPKETSLNPIRTNYRKHDGYSAENVALEVLPGVYLSGTLYMPLKLVKKNPVMLSPHGHFYNKIDKSIPNERGRYREDQQKRCATLARMGVMVFSYDMFAWGESNYQFPLKDHRQGIALTMQTWNSMRALDFLLSLKGADPERVGVTGASGGGTQTFIIAAVDDRITLSVPAVMVSSHFYGGCPCESGMPIHFMDNGLNTNNAEIAALISPKPLLVISDGDDWTETVPQIEFPYLQNIYSLYNKKENVKNVHLGSEGHDYGYSKRIAMYEFVAEHFSLKTNDVLKSDGIWDESKVTVEPATEMYVFGTNNPFPENAMMGIESLKMFLIDSQK